MMASLVPLYTFSCLLRKLSVADAAAIAATYGSISAVTFITAAAFLEKLGITYGGYMVAAMALMESPAIVVAVCFTVCGHRMKAMRLFRGANCGATHFLTARCFDYGQSDYRRVIGRCGREDLKPFTGDIFAGVLCFFLLDMGIVAARRLSDLKRAGVFLTAFAVLVPLVNAAFAIPLADCSGLSQGRCVYVHDSLRQRSYIAVPAAMRLSIPESNPSLYVPMSLAITFPSTSLRECRFIWRQSIISGGEIYAASKAHRNVIDALEVPNIVRRLEAAGVSGYTIIKDAIGMGERGLARRRVDGRFQKQLLADDLPARQSNESSKPFARF
jgi:hypothetical protein